MYVLYVSNGGVGMYVKVWVVLTPMLRVQAILNYLQKYIQTTYPSMGGQHHRKTYVFKLATNQQVCLAPQDMFRIFTQ